MTTQVNERSPMRHHASNSPSNETETGNESQRGWMWKLLTRVYKFIDKLQCYYVEVALFFFFLARHMTLPLFQEYVQTKIYSQHGLDFLSLTHNVNSSRGDQWNDAHRESVLVVLGLQIAEGLPAIVTVIILGALSDRTGRHRIMLWLPSLGSCLYAFIYILMLYTGWSVDGLFLASALRGLSGSMTAFLAGASFYAINSVKSHQRTSRLAVQEFLNGAAYAVGNLMVGFWVKDAGFLRPFWFVFICSLISLLISFFLIDETSEEANSEQQGQQSPRRNRSSGNCFKDLFQPMAKYFKCWQSSALVKIWFAILAFQTYAFVHIGQENTLVLYLTGQPYLYSWRNSITGAAPWVKIGLLLSVIMAVAAIATALCTPIFQRFLSDTSIVFIGLASKAVGTLWIAIVHNETLIFFSILLLAFELLPFPMLRSSVSRGIATSQQGSLFAMMHCGESITYFLAPFAFSAIYAGTLHYYSGLVFVVAFLLLALPVGFTYGLRYMERNNLVQYEPMGNENEGAEVNQISSADATESAMLPRGLPIEPISFIDLDQSRTESNA